MRIYRSHRHDVPGLNTASLPDLIFTVLFFFMLVTHMRQTDVKVVYTVPEGSELTTVKKKPNVAYIYIGKTAGDRNKYTLQLNDRVINNLDDLPDYIFMERQKLQPTDKQHFTVSIKADKDVPMKLVQQVKTALREADALRINYSAKETYKPLK